VKCRAREAIARTRRIVNPGREVERGGEGGGSVPERVLSFIHPVMDRIAEPIPESRAQTGRAACAAPQAAANFVTSGSAPETWAIIDEKAR